MHPPLWQVDAFADGPFQGNPAAICLLESPADPAWCQAVAAEMNLSETAFVSPRPDGSFDLRWFTPAVEVELCGHATLASAHMLWESGRLAPTAQARFHTRSGLLTADREGDWITLDFPATPPEPTPAPAGLAGMLGAAPVWIGRSPFDLVVELEDAAAVERLAPDLGALAELPYRGVIVTAPSPAPDLDFVSRFFGPACGVPEDPVTGSAHCATGPLWAGRLGKQSLVARQLSNRGGTVRLVVGPERVRLSGRAVTVLRGELVTRPG